MGNREKIQKQLEQRLKSRKAKKLADKQDKLEKNANDNLNELHQEHKKEIDKLIEGVNQKVEDVTNKNIDQTKLEEDTKPRPITPETKPKKIEKSKSILSLGPDFTGILSNLSNIKSTLVNYDPEVLKKISNQIEKAGKEISGSDDLSGRVDFPTLVNFKPIPIDVENLPKDLVQKHNFLQYTSKILTLTEHISFKKMITVLICQNSNLPGYSKLKINPGYYYDEINAIIWVSLENLSSNKASQLSLDICKIISKVNEVNYSKAVSIITKNMYLFRLENGTENSTDASSSVVEKNLRVDMS